MNIKLLGYFDKNFGDDLMQLIVVKNMPEHDFFAECAQKEFLTHFRGCENIHLNVDNVKIDAYVNIIGTGFKFSSKMNIITKFMSIPHEQKLPFEKTAVIDCSVDMPKNAAERFLVKRELNKYSHISCRDADSEKIIAELSGKSILRRHEDIVFALGNEYIYPKTGEDLLGIVPVQRGFSGKNFEYYETVAKACDRYIQKYGKNVLIFALDTGYENDLLAAMSIKRLMKYGDKTEIIAYNGEAKYIFENMARCEKIISSRFHGVIAAILAETAVAAVSDRSKIDILSEKLKFEKIPKEGLAENALFDLIERTNRPIYADDEIREDARRHLDELGIFLRRGERT